MTIEEIQALDCELNVYRKGCLSVSLNFRQHIMVWRESRQWCNNFVRSLTDEQIGEIRSLIKSSGLLDAPDLLADSSAPVGPLVRHNLKLTVSWPDNQLVLETQDADQPNWLILRKKIEKLSHVPFHL